MRTLTVTFDARDAAGLAGFWAGMLGRETVRDGDRVRLPGEKGQLSLAFVPGPAQKPGARSSHLHLTSATPDDQQRTVEAALRRGAGHLDVGQLPEEGHIVLADPEGNPFCVIEAGNRYLAGCGFLGELACDGTREVGVFWSAALGWPLVWDENGETAIQSPDGGTKIAWGGPPLDPKDGHNRQRLEIDPRTEDRQAEIARLITLGATPVEDGFLEDPDGNEFTLAAPRT
jgi:catechol 2,3-dioxygenase-like lactoylglutathione lyase family enzyme